MVGKEANESVVTFAVGLVVVYIVDSFSLSVCLFLFLLLIQVSNTID